MVCVKCNTKISGSSSNCPKCGTPVIGLEMVKANAKVCPLCMAQYPQTAMFCKHDGQTLREASIPTAPETKQEMSATGLTCPICGTSHPLTAKFCKIDGTALSALKNQSPSGIQREVRQDTKSDYTQAAPSLQWQHSANNCQKSEKSRQVTLIWVLAAVLLLGGSGAGGYYFSALKTYNDTVVPLRVDSAPVQGQVGYAKPKYKRGSESGQPTSAEQRGSLTPDFSRDRVKELVDAFVKCSNSKNYQILDLYADEVNTFSGKIVTKERLRKDAENYFKRWNNIYFTLSNDFVIADIPNSNNKKKIVFYFNYQLENARKFASGVSQTVWIIESQDGQLKILDQKENIITNPSLTLSPGFWD